MHDVFTNSERMTRRSMLSKLAAGALLTGPFAATAFARKPKPRKPDVIYVPTPQDVVDKMLEVAKVKKTDLVYDLGSGDGRIVITAAKRYGCKAVGFEIDPKLVKVTRANAEKNKVGKLVRIKQQDIFKLDLSKADVVTLYLRPDLNRRLIPQLQKLRTGTRVISHEFPIRGVKPDKIVLFDSKETELEHSIYVWTAPLKVPR
jgi:SAM-dependent methyltransferase